MSPSAPRRRPRAFPGVLLLALLSALLRGAPAEPSGQKEKPLPLPPLKVKGEARCSFGFGVTLLRDAETRKVTQVFISTIHEFSHAANFGLKEGDEILALNGEKVRGMSGELKRGSRLFDLLVDRPPGENIEVEIKAAKTTRITLTAARF